MELCEVVSPERIEKIEFIRSVNGTAIDGCNDFN